MFGASLRDALGFIRRNMGHGTKDMRDKFFSGLMKAVRDCWREENLNTSMSWLVEELLKNSEEFKSILKTVKERDGEDGVDAYLKTLKGAIAEGVDFAGEQYR